MQRDNELKKQAEVESTKSKSTPSKTKARASKVTEKATASKVTKKATASKVTKKATASKVTKKATASKVTKKAVHTRPRLQVKYRNEATATLMEEFGYSNVMEVPRLQKMVVNIGVGEALTNGKALEGATKDLITITGQKPVITRAKKDIAEYKLRKGVGIGACVTLRGDRMYHLLDRLCNVSLSRIRDFRGVPRRSFDGRGNYSIGIREQVIFPEIDYNSIDKIRSLQVTVTTTAKTDREAMRLLELLEMPFERQ